MTEKALSTPRNKPKRMTKWDWLWTILLLAYGVFMLLAFFKSLLPYNLYESLSPPCIGFSHNWEAEIVMDEPKVAPPCIGFSHNWEEMPDKSYKKCRVCRLKYYPESKPNRSWFNHLDLEIINDDRAGEASIRWDDSDYKR